MTRTSVCRFACLGASMALVCFASLQAQAQDAAMFRGSTARVGNFGSALRSAPTGVKWRFRTNGSILSSPTVSGGVAYVGSNDGFLYAVNTATGTLKWKFKTDRRIPSSPAIVDGVVFFGSYDSNVYAVDAATGKLKWKFATQGERRFAKRGLEGGAPTGEMLSDNWDFYLSSPVVWQGTLYFGSGDGNVYALSLRDGSVKWRFGTGDVVHASPAIANGTLFIGSWDAHFYALDATTGKLKWRLKTGTDSVYHNQEGFQSSAAVVDGVVYVGARDSHVYAIDAATGRKKWEYGTEGAWVSSSPSVRNGKVYVGTGDSGLLLVLDAATGKLVAKQPLGWMIFGSPAVAGNMLYVGSMDGEFAAMDLSSNTFVWKYRSDSARVNRVKYADKDGKISFAKLIAEPFYDDWGVRMAKIFSMGAFLSSPFVADGVVYVGSTDGYLYAFK